jgi:signal recognition particle GTPase
MDSDKILLVVITGISSIVVGILGKVIWEFFTKDKDALDSVSKSLNQFKDTINVKFDEFSKKLEKHNEEFTRRFHELEKTLIQNYVRKEDLEKLQIELRDLREHNRDNNRDIEILQSQLTDVVERLNKGLDRRT